MKPRNMRLALGILAWFLVVFTGSAGAAKVQWTVASGGNDHWYEAVATGGTWTAAQAAAAAAGGYLATATSIEENTFIHSLVTDWNTYWFNDGANNSQGPWLGGYWGGGENIKTNWKWVTGESWSYQNWASGEPNFNTEHYVQFFGPGMNNPASTWNNLSDSSAVKGYVVEYVPLPGALVLLGSGLAGLAVYRRRR